MSHFWMNLALFQKESWLKSQLIAIVYSKNVHSKMPNCKYKQNCSKKVVKISNKFATGLKLNGTHSKETWPQTERIFCKFTLYYISLTSIWTILNWTCFFLAQNAFSSRPYCNAVLSADMKNVIFKITHLALTEGRQF